MRLGVVEYIDCAHFLPGHGKCGRLHGHTYKIEFMIDGRPASGMVMDFADMKKVLRSICHEYDHGSWNDYLDYPTVENISLLLAGRLKEVLPFAFRLRVWEGHGKWAEVHSGEDPVTSGPNEDEGEE